jgi:hypothetical protein
VRQGGANEEEKSNKLLAIKEKWVLRSGKRAKRAAGKKGKTKKAKCLVFIVFEINNTV